jgi:ASPIC and UnbV/FG-GAP-like repeat/Secretion system C-terminal sorting domain/SprB repeat
MIKCVCAVILCLSGFHPLWGQLFTNIGPENEIWHQDNSIDFGSGVSLADVNNDGLDDITLLSAFNGVRLYLNSPNGFTYHELNINLPFELKQAVWIDVDNNGLRDLAVTSYGGPFKVFQNMGDLVLVDVTESTGITEENYLTYAQSWADYDRDGDVDLYISNYNANGFGDPEVENYLYSNDGDFTFTDVTSFAGIGNGSTETLAATWFDHNNDLWPDLMIANDRGYTPNALYLNNTDGTFTDISQSTGTHIFIDAMGLAIDDFSGDGNEDIYVTNNWGNRLHKSHNDMYVEANSLFDDNVDFLSWGASWLDYDNDGLLDLYVAVDYYLTEQNYNRMYRQETDGTFYKVPVGSSYLADQGHNYGTAVGDFNNDGYQDVSVVSSSPYNSKFWQNNLSTNNWLKCTLQGTVSNSDAVGSTIRCYSSQHHARQSVRCGESYLSQNSFTEFFGLGTDELVDSLIVLWPSGIVDKWFNIPVNQSLHLIEGESFIVSYSAQHPVRLCNNNIVHLDIENEGLVGVHWNVDYTGSTLSIIDPGAYVATFNDVWGNQFLSDTIFAFYPSQPNALWSLSQPLCSDDLANFQMLDSDDYTWELEGLSMVDSTSVELISGPNELVLSDGNGCQFSYDLQVVVPAPLQAEVQLNGTSCFGECDGHVVVNASGGTGALNWSIPNPEELFWCAGPHEIVITDANGCLLEVNFEIGQPEPIQILPTLTNPLCFGQGNGQIDIDVVGGTGSYQFNADFVIGQNLPAGMYTAIVIDGLGCIVEQSILLEEPDELTIEIAAMNDNEGQGVGGIHAVPQGGTPPYTYWWSNGAGNVATLNGLMAGQYMLQVVDANGCSVQEVVVLEDMINVEDFEAQFIQIYPNPASEYIQVSSTAVVYDLRVYDAQGKLLIDGLPGHGRIQCGAWATGCYMVLATTSQGNIQRKIMVNRD